MLPTHALPSLMLQQINYPPSCLVYMRIKLQQYSPLANIMFPNINHLFILTYEHTISSTLKIYLNRTFKLLPIFYLPFF